MSTASLPKPLEGVRVLDLTRVFAGPIAGRTLSDLGADVVKVEPPDGDVTRLWGRKTAGLSSYFTQQNCGKRNVCIDLNADGGPELVARLAAQADVVIENFRPGVMAKFGIDWSALSERKPSLIMLSISGFGQEGPESQRAAYASIIHAESGILPPAEGDEMPLDLDLSAADVLSGMHGVIAVLAALRTRDATGVGQYIDMAMMDAMTFSADIIINSLDGARRAESINGEVWRTVDGPKMVPGGLRWIWHQLSTTAGLSDATPPDADISQKIASRRTIITDFLCGLPDRAAVIEAFDAANLAWADVRECGEVLESPTLVHRETVVEVDDRCGGTRKVIRNPYRMSATDLSDIGVAAFRGEHNTEVLAEWLGVGTEGVDALSTDEWADGDSS
ncbi:MAG: CaiB/BaiF CoA-transferase family protein [Ilumatobacter sp.]|uniref:CaiB/BaiF CoA transferase family protein n=1 Tax=Ilumatobacter sp. TaxID=1967498 RepID=UPI003C74BC0E